ncbi:MAG: SDR family NAD(P)-dependent oxidoreductase [Candidatus Saccharimonadales bacterium]
MKMTNNTILITGGGSGIGRALAEMFHAKGNKVIIAGRRQALLDEVAHANDGIETIALDISNSDSIEDVVAKLEETHPGLNTVIHNAGIMKPEEIGNNDRDISRAIIETNLIGQINLNSALLPLLKKQSEGTIMTVSSGLAFLPTATFPTYNATKAAIHSYTQSLRTQLAHTKLQVIELIPPYVQTELISPEQAHDPNAMPLKDFIEEVGSILETQPDIKEVCVEKVMFQRTAEASGEYDARYQQRNQAYISE